MRPFILVHGPLIGPFTWVPVAAELRKLGASAVIPALNSPAARQGTYWEHHCKEFALELGDVSMDTGEAVLVGHSGAGPLLPQLGLQLASGPAAYVLVDSDLPRDGASRFDLFENPAHVEDFRRIAGEPYSPRGRLSPQPGLKPSDETVREWPGDLLSEALTQNPDNTLDVQSTVFAGKRPTPIAVLDEPLPVPASWPEAPVGYLHLSPTYDGAAAAAGSQGWPVRALSTSHVQMLLEPESFARELAEFAEEVAG